MSVFVKDIIADKDILKITGRDYFILRNIFVGSTDEEKKSRLLKSLMVFRTPCLSSEDLENSFRVMQQKINECELQNAAPDSLIWRLLPNLASLLNCQFVIIRNSRVIKGRKNNTDSVIFVVIRTIGNDCVEVDNGIDVIFETKTYDLSLVVSCSDFEKVLDYTHNHVIDSCQSVELFPLDYCKEMRTENFCRLSISAFSPKETLQKIQKTCAIADTVHSPSSIVMKTKRICRKIQNYGYLSPDLPQEFFVAFLGQFFSVFNEEIETLGFAKFVSGQFKQSVLLSCNQEPSSSNIHDEFISSNSSILSNFVERFEKYANFETNEKLVATAMAPSLSKDQNIYKNLVLYYEGICRNNALRKVLQHSLVDYENVLHDNQKLVHNIEIIGKENEDIKGQVKDALGKIKDSVRENVRLKTKIIRDVETKEKITKLTIEKCKELKTETVRLTAENVSLQEDKNYLSAQNERLLEENRRTIRLERLETDISVENDNLKQQLLEKNIENEKLVQQLEEMRKKADDANSECLHLKNLNAIQIARMEEMNTEANIQNQKIEESLKVQEQEMLKTQEVIMKRQQDKETYDEKMKEMKENVIKEQEKVLEREKARRQEELNIISDEKLDLQIELEGTRKELEEKTKQCLSKEQVTVLKRKLNASNNKSRELETKLKKKEEQIKDENVEKTNKKEEYLEQIKEKQIEIDNLKKSSTKNKTRQAKYIMENKNKIENLQEICKKNEIDLKEEQSRLELEIANIRATANDDVQRSNDKIDLLEREKKKLDSDISSLNKTHEQEMEELLNTMKKEISCKEKEISCKEKEIANETKKNDEKKKQHFYSDATRILSMAKHNPGELKHSSTFTIQGTSKSISVRVKSGSSTEQNKLIKLVMHTATKMMSATTTKKLNTIKKSIQDGKRHMAAVKLMESRMKTCFLKGSLQTQSIALFKEIVEAIQCFYQIQLPNLNFCLDSCYPSSNCTDENRECPNPIDIVVLLQNYSCAYLDTTIDAVKKFKLSIYTNY